MIYSTSAISGSSWQYATTGSGNGNKPLLEPLMTAISYPHGQYVTVRRRYNAVQCNSILHTSLQRLRQRNINEGSNTQNGRTPNTSPKRASYGMSFVMLWKKIDRVITAPYCISQGIYVGKKHDGIDDIQSNTCCPCILKPVICCLSAKNLSGGDGFVVNVHLRNPERNRRKRNLTHCGAIQRHRSGSTLVQVIVATKPLPEPMLTYHQGSVTETHCKVFEDYML